jgi:plasmid maintenance system antidote protein VapI
MSTIPVDRHLRHFISAGWSVRRLAQFAGVPERTMRHWINETGEIPIEAARRLVQRLHMLQTEIAETARRIEAHLHD